MYFNAGTIPWYLNMLGLGLTDNYLGCIIPCIVAPYNIILVKTYCESIPAALEESAYIDGATTMQVFTQIILPLSKPILMIYTVSKTAMPLFRTIESGEEAEGDVTLPSDLY